jgi:Protein of unknown function (DUF974)
MRLRKPNLVPQASTTIAPSPFTTPALARIQSSSTIDTLVQSTGLTGLAALPNGFGSMFVGTTFSAYVCLNNEASEPVEEVKVTAELRSPPDKVALNPRCVRVGDQKEYTTEEKVKLLPSEALHLILDHRLAPLPPRF